MYVTIGRGRGYRPAEENKDDEQPIGVIPIDSIFSPIRRASYTVEAARVGQRTDFDKLTLELETDGSIEAFRPLCVKLPRSSSRPSRSSVIPTGSRN